MSKQLFEIDDRTGEAKVLSLQDYSIISKSQLAAYKQKQAHDEEKARRQYYARMSTNTERPFIWEIYELSTQWSPGISPANVTRMIYLSTYLTYDGVLAYDNGRPVARSGLASLLGVSERQGYNFWNQMVSEGIFTERDDGAIAVNPEVFRKGSITNREIGAMVKENKYFMKLYVDGVRQLYQTASVRSAKTLSYMFQVLPFVNREYNVVCHNPLETDPRKIRPMRLGEFCDLVGYSRKHIRRMSRQLADPTFIVKGFEQSAIGYVCNRGICQEEFSIFINPNVYYAGSQHARVEVLGAFFEEEPVEHS